MSDLRHNVWFTLLGRRHPGGGGEGDREGRDPRWRRAIGHDDQGLAAEAAQQIIYLELLKW